MKIEQHHSGLNVPGSITRATGFEAPSLSQRIVKATQEFFKFHPTLLDMACNAQYIFFATLLLGRFSLRDSILLGLPVGALSGGAIFIRRSLQQE